MTSTPAPGRARKAPASRTRRVPVALAVVALVAPAVVAGVLVAVGREGEAVPGRSASAGVGEVLGIRPGDTVVTFEGEPVGGAEVLRAAETVRAEVISEFAGQGLGPGFWERARDGVTPARRLRERAVRAAVLDKARRIWAREAGLLTDVGEQGFQRELAAENARRAEAARSGRPIPGVPSYDQYTYARVRAAELDAALEKLHASSLDLSERRLRDQYARTAGPGAPPFDQVRENVRRQLVRQGYEQALQARAAP
ncbi:hypothetical protein ACFFV7_22750 [Nonomuraea spiralis]|uniref:PDZ domain-containing protein n=1 Tax=Nonomuraea spiralis TaxID=46182 RepID=A0ABV5IHK5_9ACTN|nr:hypothetical protein [Nonomuraea spiralis]GGS94769.1 hypothetical protein GCM10010176_043270 [Nonomuraea spiralis]